jgi:hypothetical protein
VEKVNSQDAVEGLRSKACAPAALAARGVPRVRRRLCVALWLAVFTFLSAAYSPAQQVGPTESQVKAAYLFNFGKFVRWPAPPDSRKHSLEICVLGKNPFGSVLDATVKGETIDGKSVVARSVLSLHEAESCHILFVSQSEEARLTAILAGAKRLQALTVSDIPHFAERGGMIGLVNQADRIRFEVNVAPLENAGLTVSSELLKVALRVIRKSAGGD